MAETSIKAEGETREKTVAKMAGAKRFVVAIHGIGDQFENATIQTVVSAFGRYADYPATVPLGGFRPRSTAVKYFHFDPTDPPSLPVPEFLLETGFVEIYWANVPREAQKEGHIIEESKAWARTIVERVRARYGGVAANLNRKVKGRDGKERHFQLTLGDDDYLAGADAIEEMIETLAVLDNLLWVVERAGLFKFDLEKLLTTYLGDVQIVADFADYRATIIKRFLDVLEDLHTANPDAEIHIVAHSEGTVVALLGLLAGLSWERDPRTNLEVKPPPALPGWARQVRGLMTFGSPIDKHLVLWPAIFDPVSTLHPDLWQGSGKPPHAGIQWHNYYDFGDPVGYRLDTAHRWIRDHGWDGIFQFDEAGHDHGFSRYLLPGAAHNNYWQDDAVFGHFITKVIEKEACRHDRVKFSQPPESSRLNQIASNVLPYLLIYGVIYAGLYFLYKGISEYVLPDAARLDLKEMIRNVTGTSALLFGTVALARIPRLTRSRTWCVAAFGVYAVGAFIYASPLVKPETRIWQALRLFGEDGVTANALSTAFMITLAALIAIFAAWGSRQKLRKWTAFPLSWLRPLFVGARPLLVPGFLYILLIIGYRVWVTKGAHPIYPLFLTGAAFLYLWWLGILLFDLVFVWHRYIRNSVAHDYLMALRLDRRAKAGAKSPEGTAKPESQ